MRSAILSNAACWCLAMVMLATASFGQETSNNNDDAIVMDGDANIVDNRDLLTKPVEDPAFNIALVFDTSITPTQKAGFTRAVAKWTSVITKDFAAMLCIPAGKKLCGHKFVKQTCIDDLLIAVNVKPIDGVNRILGSAGPCVGDNTGKIRMGVMTFDSADANYLITNNMWDATVMHEMGHVLGLGTLWDSTGLITPVGQTPILYEGAQGNIGNVDVGGHGKAEIEDQGGPGTARGHWSERAFDSELMTGYVERPGIPMPMSKVTVGALMDLCYDVDLTKADPYTKPASTGRRLRTEEKLALGNDMFVTEIEEMDGADVVVAKKGREAEFEAAKARHQAKKHNKNH